MSLARPLRYSRSRTHTYNEVLAAGALIECGAPASKTDVSPGRERGMGYTFDAHLAGGIATEPTLGGTKDDRPWTKFRLAVDNRIRTDTGE